LATSNSYTLQATDVGTTLRVQVTATNAAGPGAPAQSAQTAVVTSAPAVSNLAPDPDFEQSPTPWYFTHGTGTFSWASDQSRSPSHALKIVTSSSSLTRWMTNTKQIAAQAGKRYTASAYAKTSSVSGSVRVTLTFWNASASYLGVAADSTTTLSGTQNWTQLTASATAPTGTAYIRVELRLTGPGTTWFDDLTLTQP
jgi:hypothetical protein